MTRLIVHNTRYEDEIEFEVEDVSDEEIEEIKAQLLARGWELSDCWSEVKE